MSFFKSIKGTLNSVQKDISNSFKSFAAASQTPHIVTKKKAVSTLHHFDSDVNPDAGADLLNKNEDAWAEIHKNIEESAKMAQIVDIDVSDIFVFYERQNEALGEFITELSTLPKLTVDINNIMKQLGDLEKDFMSMENMLLTLEDVCEQQELVANKHKHFVQLEAYKQQKIMEFEQAKVGLANEHAKKAQEYESKLQESLREKQQAFEETYHFEEQIKNYKLSGETKLTKQSSTTSSDADLAEICVDEDNTALEAFLQQPDEHSNSDSLQVNNNNTVKEAEDSDEEEEFKDTEQEIIQITPDGDINDEDLVNETTKTTENVEETNVASSTETSD